MRIKEPMRAQRVTHAELACNAGRVLQLDRSRTTERIGQRTAGLRITEVGEVDAQTHVRLETLDWREVVLPEERRGIDRHGRNTS
jgi:hypothetical protein